MLDVLEPLVRPVGEDASAERRYVVRTRADSPALARAAVALETSSWNQLGYLNFTRAHYAFYSDLLARFPDYQLCLVDEETNYPVAVACCVPLACDPNQLPAEGWDWIVESAAMQHQKPNMLGALAISVPSVHRSQGHARRMIRAMRELAVAKGLDGLIAPVRPTSKASHPFSTIEDYIGWTDSRGRPYDPWIRSHLAEGGRIVGPCHRSMVVEEPLAFWETWTAQRFATTGDYTVDGALVPLHVDVERQTGSYVEPNVWIAYPR